MQSIVAGRRSVIIGPVMACAIIDWGQLLFAQLFVVTTVDQSFVMVDKIRLVLDHQIEFERDQYGKFVGDDLFSVVESKFGDDGIDELIDLLFGDIVELGSQYETIGGQIFSVYFVDETLGLRGKVSSTDSFKIFKHGIWEFLLVKWAFRKRCKTGRRWSCRAMLRKRFPPFLVWCLKWCEGNELRPENQMWLPRLWFLPSELG